MSAAFERARSLESLGLEHGFGTAHTPAAVERLVTVRQVHGNRVLCVPPVTDGAEADALLAREPGVAVGVFTADCVPVLIADRQGRGVMAVHAGWRGTAARVGIAAVRELCAQVGCAPQSLMAAIGPYIGPCCYEVDRPVYDAFDDHAAFTSARAEHWTLDLGLANRRQLVSAGIPVEAIERVGRCTACTPGAYASYRRDGTGQRMLHWIRVPAA